MARITPAGCSAALAAVVQEVTDGGQVHQYRRIIRDEQALRNLMWDGANDRINGWMISPANAEPAVTVRHPGYQAIGQSGGGQAETVFQFQIEAYFGIDDANASEVTFRDLVWQVADTLNGYGLLDIPGVIEQLPAQVGQFGYVMLAGFTFLHYARIDIAFRGRTRP